MPLSLNFIEQLGLIHLNKGPGPMSDIIGALGFKAIGVALELNIFEQLHNNPLTPEELAKKIGAQSEGITLLLQALVNLGYLKYNGEQYSNTPMTTTWMLNDSKQSMTGIFHHIEDALERWNYLGESIRKGVKAKGLDKWFDRADDRWLRYHSGMRSIAKIVCNTVVGKVRLPKTAKKLLDIGGSHGLYSIQFCQKNPNLLATIIDLPAARTTAEETIRTEGMQGRIDFLEGDFVKDPIGNMYDVLLLFNFIRIFDPEDLKIVFKKSASLLNNNGMIVILDQFGQPDMSRFTKTNHSLMLLELYNQLHKRAHSSDETVRYLTDCGFSSPTKIPLLRVGGLGIVTAYKVM